jgi:Family of unknown function (DUF6461)
VSPPREPGLNDDDLAAYDWADGNRDPRLEALALTLVEPASDAHLSKLNPRSELPGLLTVAEALDAIQRLDDYAWGSVLAQTDTLGDWSVLLEPMGWVASDPGVLARLSEGGSAVNVYWNVNGVMSFGLARDGVLVRQFDPLLYDDAADALPEERDLPFGEPGRVVAASLALLTRMTGVRIDRTWLLERPRPTFVVPLA